MSEMFLCYDLKGIQSFIFAVPRLRYICGGSALIDQFDRETVGKIMVPDTELLFAGGGKGAFRCAGKEAADRVQDELVHRAHEVGLSICLGRHESFSEASHLADRSFPYLPNGKEDLDGHPCGASGLFPVADGDVHWTIRERVWQRGDPMSRRFENQLLQGIKLPSFIADSNKCMFIHDVSSDTSGEGGGYGYDALGGRNRWAIISMDGNDIGSQHRAAAEKWGGNPDKMLPWLLEMSIGSDLCSRGACKAAIERVLKEWAADRKELDRATEPDGTVWLPIRPLILGGDDMVVICHVRHALDFVREASRSFTDLSIELAEQAKNKKGIELWPATGGQVTITAGILFAPVTLPLATAISFSESLMASAKSKGRRLATTGSPSPACVDWESVTEGVLDGVADRRQRELRFWDDDIKEVVNLTRRPYTLEELGELEGLMAEYGKLPATIRHQVLPGLRAGFWDRQIFAARMGKNQGALTKDLREPEHLDGKDLRGPGHLDDQESGRWKPGPSFTFKGLSGNTRSTDVVDALLLLEESGRMERQTAGKETI